MQCLREVLPSLCSGNAADSKPWVSGVSPHYRNCSPLRNKEQLKELKGRAGVGEGYEKKKFKIVMEELAIMNPFLIPLRHMLALIP